MIFWEQALTWCPQALSGTKYGGAFLESECINRLLYNLNQVDFNIMNISFKTESVLHDFKKAPGFFRR
jgi:hypothetical protein